MLKAKKKFENDYKNIFYCPMKGEDNDNIGIILESIICTYVVSGCSHSEPKQRAAAVLCAVTKSKVRKIKFKFEKIEDA